MELLADGDVTLFEGDAVFKLGEIAPESIDALVADPPYALDFMGQAWDRHTSPREFGEWCRIWAGEALKTVKPGGYALVFGGSRTWHRLTVALEDAGWEIRDTITWLYGSGFPKSLDVSKAIDARLGASRPVVGQLDVNAAMRGGNYAAGAAATRDLVDVTTAGSEQAAAWAGWGTALKPAFEPIIVARKPFRGTVAENVLAYGVGAINVDGCRTQLDPDDRAVAEAKNRHADFGSGARENAVYGSDNSSRADGGNWSGEAGRWPTNVLLSHGPDCQQIGWRTVASNSHHPAARPAGGIGNDGHAGQEKLHERRPRVEAVEAWQCQPDCPVSGLGDAARFFPRFRYGAKAPDGERPVVDGIEHSTVKPLDLMRWLVRLVTPPGGLLLDPFAGSGTTGHAAVLEGMRAVLIERAPEYLPLIRSRFTGPIAAAMF